MLRVISRTNDNRSKSHLTFNAAEGIDMRYLVILLLTLGLVFQSGCTSQARKTHLVFENENATYQELHQTLEELKPVGHKGATDLQFKAVKTLRHISKYMTDPAKREMGTRGLVFLAAFNDDLDVQRSCNSRLDTMLKDPNETWALKAVIIDELKKIMMAESGYTVESKSFFSGQEERVFIRPETGARENALEFLIDRFTDLPEYLQYLTVQAFGEFIQHPVTCYEKDGDACTKDDAEDLAEWKDELRENIGDWLENLGVSEMIKLSLIRMTAESQEPNQNTEAATENLARFWLEKWAGDTDIPEATRKLIRVALDKAEHLYPELAETTSESGAAIYAADESYRTLDLFDDNAFWYANAGKILEDQLFLPRPKSPQPATEAAASKTGPVDEFLQGPFQWIFAAGYSNNPKQKQLREIVYYESARALSLGYQLSPADDPVFNLEQALTSATGESIWALDRTLSIVGKLYPSLLSQQVDGESLVDMLAKRLTAAQDLHTRRLYYDTLVEAMPYFPSIVEPTLCGSLNREDLLTRHLVRKKVATLQSPLELLTRKKQVQERQADFFQSFCDQPIERKVVPVEKTVPETQLQTSPGSGEKPAETTAGPSSERLEDETKPE